MADTKISALTNLTGANLAGGDEFVVVDASAVATKAVTYTELLAALDVDNATKTATTQSGTTYTIDADDHNTTVIFSNASAVTVTIPTDASDDLIDGYRVMLFSSGAGGLTLSTTGITLVGSSPNKTISQNEGIYLEKTGTADTWIVVGGTAA